MPSDGAGAKHLCVVESSGGLYERLDENMCSEVHSCLSCDSDGNCQNLPMESCNDTVGYSVKDHERILTWGRNHCK